MPVGDATLLRTRLLFCLIGFAESAYVPFLPLLLRERGLDAQAIGAVLALYAAVGFAAGPVWGYLADRTVGRERALAISLCGIVVTATLFGLAYSTVALAAVGALLWFFRSPVLALADVLALDRLGVDRRDAYGMVRLWMSVAFAVGAIGWGIAIQERGIGVMAPGYAVLTAFNAALVIAVFRGRWPRPIVVAPHERRGLGLGGAPSLVLFLLAILLMFAPFTASYNFAAVQIAALGGGAAFIGLAGGLQAAAEVPTMVATSRYAARMRPAHVFAAGAFFYVLVYAVWAVVRDPAVLAATRVLAGFGFGLTTVGAVVIADELVPKRLRATGQAASKAVSGGLAPVAGSLGGGLVFGYFGATAMFVLAAVLACTSALVAWAAESVQLRTAEQPS